MPFCKECGRPIDEMEDEANKGYCAECLDVIFEDGSRIVIKD